MKPELLEDVSDEMEMNRQLMEKVMADDDIPIFVNSLVWMTWLQLLEQRNIARQFWAG